MVSNTAQAGDLKEGGDTGLPPWIDDLGTEHPVDGG